MDDGTDAECRIKGNFRIRGIRSTNPVAVGDYVEVQRDNIPCTKDKCQSTSWITDVCERRNYIIRKSTNLSKESHILAANIDQVALIITINHPVTSTTFIDRFLATCEAYRVPALLIFNKIDLLTEEELAHLADLRSLYQSIGYETMEMSAISIQPSDILPLLAGKVTLLSGNSGVGKSTLLNALFGREVTRTGKISDAHDKGMHTTTFSEMYELDVRRDDVRCTKEDVRCTKDDVRCTKDDVRCTKGWIIDTPGIKGFGSVDMSKEEVSHYFREIFRISRDCRFGNCTHTNEPGCAVIEAVEHGEIAMSRYESYLSLIGDCDEAKYR